MLESAARICGANFGNIFRWDGDALYLIATHNTPPAFAEARRRSPFRPDPNGRFGRMLETKTVVHLADAAAEKAYTEQREPGIVAAVELGGVRTILFVPMLKEDKLIGVFSLYRQEVRPFTDKQIELIKNFAAQAVIAIENTRLLNELRQRTTDLTERTADLTEALEQQTATSEVLQVISSSSGDIEPAFRTVLENAVRLCDANFGTINRWDGEALHLVATHKVPPAFAEFRRRTPFRPGPENPISRMLMTKTVIHFRNLAGEQGYIERNPTFVAAVELGGVRTFLAVPMLKENELIGVVIVYRQEVRPFTDKQIELVKNFAAQAVIAIENARLLNELRQRTDDLTEALQQETATSEVLQVISSSPGDLEPVFVTMLEKAVRICDAKFGNIYRWDGEALHLVATHNTPPAFAEERRRSPYRPHPHYPIGQMVATKTAVHIRDVTAEEAYIARHDQGAIQGVELGGIRTFLAVPLLNKGELIGAFFLSRQEVRPFTDKQIGLVENFAAQAVIAIENARLLNELRQRTTDLTERTADLSEALDQQTATSNVLQVISGSQGDLQPVFATILENAVRVCEASFGVLTLYEGDDHFRVVAMHNGPKAYVELRRREPVISPGPFVRMVATRQAFQISDMTDQLAYKEKSDPNLVSFIELTGVRTNLSVPMLKEKELIGIITVYRTEVRPFGDKQMELLKNFAAQAVIAIENARLLNELRQSLEQQTATSEVLQVISSSPGELAPVFATMLEKAVRICDAKYGTLYLRDDDRLRLVAAHDVPEFFAARRGVAFDPAPEGGLNEAIRTKRAVQITDLAATKSYFDRHPSMVEAVELAGIRTGMAVPMLKDDNLIGIIGIHRREVLPFTDKQIELVKNFAAQAVIAIENARLLNELRQRTNDLSQRTTDLTEALDQQTATSDVLEVISRSAFDLQAVFQTVAESSVRLCGADRAFIFRFDGELLRMVVAYNSSPDFVEWVANHPIRPGRHSGSARAALERRTIHVPDVLADPEYTYGAKGVEPIRTILGVPILKGDDLLGVMMIYRLEVRPFTDRQIALVETFADQAAIAIENVRLLDELRENRRG